MSVRPLDLVWDVEAEPWAFPVRVRQIGWAPWVRQFGTSVRVLRCPGCMSIIYSRRHKFCNVCNQELPESLRFSEAEAHRVESLLEAERARHRKWMRRWSASGG